MFFVIKLLSRIMLFASVNPSTLNAFPLVLTKLRGLYSEIMTTGLQSSHFSSCSVTDLLAFHPYPSKLMSLKGAKNHCAIFNK